VWGTSYRLVKDDLDLRPCFLPRRLSQHTFSAFAQDEIALVGDRLVLRSGRRSSAMTYTGLELQPSIRLRVEREDEAHRLESSRGAVRTPSRLDRDLIVPPVSAGGPNFESKELLAYEVGYRTRLRERALP